MFDFSRWTLYSVSQCLENYSELLEVYRASFVGSPLGIIGESMSSGMRVYFARMNLLSTKWDLDKALTALSWRYKALFVLRYLGHCTQQEIADILECDQATASRMLQRLPQKVLTILLNGA